MPIATRAKIDFDEWSELAHSDPDAFEVRRAELLEEMITNSNRERQARLRRLQWRIDQIRRLAGTPLGACIKLNTLMLDTVLGEGGLLESMNRLGPRRRGERYRPLPDAQILPFTPRAGWRH